MNFGDLLFRLLADDSGFEADVVKKADKAGAAGEKTLGQRLGGALKTGGVKAFGAVTSAAFAIASAGALKLTEIQARFQAETGASADEAKAAAKIINTTAGRERADLNEVADAAISIRQNLGATGDEADHLTERFTRYGRITKQIPAAAVKDFDDILDGWNLTADKTDGIMDKLIASHEKYGGAIDADQKALGAMAPQLKAFNLGIDDGIALLDLFKSSGLDVAEIPKTLNTAFQNLDGKSLPAFIKELAGIEDPAKRAERAVEIFGSKAGLKLANAIKPGMDSLDDLGISAEDSAGKLDKAADIIDSTPWGKFQTFLSEAAAGLRGFGDDFGPLLTGLAGIGTLLGTSFSKQLFEAGKDAGGALLDGVGTVTGAAGTVFGNLIAQALDPHNPFLNGVIGKSAAKIGGAIGAGVAVSSRIGDAIGAAIDKVPGSAKVKAAVSRAGTAIGGPLGLAIGLTAATVFVVWFVQELNRQRDEVAGAAKSIGESVSDEIAHGSTAQLETAQAAIKTGMDAIVAETKTGFLQMANPQQLDALQDLTDQYNRIQEELNRRAEANAKALQYAIEGSKQGTAQAAEDLAAEIPKGWQKSAGQLAAAAREFLRKPIGEQLRLIGAAGIRAGASLSLDLASSIRQNRGDIDSAMDQLRDDIQHRLTPKKEVAKRIAQLFGKTLSDSLHDTDPLIKKQAQGTRGLIEAELIETIKAGGKAGEQIQDELKKKLNSKDPDVRRQAQRTKSLVDAALKEQPPKTPGEKIGQDLASDIGNANGPVGRKAYQLGVTIARNILRGVDGIGASIPSSGNGSTGLYSGKNLGGDSYDIGTSYVPRTGPAVVHQSEIIVPAADSRDIRSGAAVLGTASATARGGGPLIGQLNVDASGHDNPAAVYEAVKRAASDAVTRTLRDESLRGPVGTRP
jgi:hypothetical protein